MNHVSLLALTHAFGSIRLDDNSIALIALLAGMVGGWTLTGWREQLRARKAKAPTRRR